MSGMWNPGGRPRKVKQPVISGHTLETRKGGLYLVPRNRKGKTLWELARYVGEAPVMDLDPNQAPVMTDAEPEYAEIDEATSEA